MKASSGSATVLGHNASTQPNQVQKSVAYLPESVTLYGHLSGVENIRYFLSMAGVDKSDDDMFAAPQGRTSRRFVE